MYKVCPDCRYFGQAKRNVSRTDFYSGIFLTIVGGLALTVDADILGSRLIYILMMLYVLIIGVYEVLGYYYGSKTCLKCGNKEMLSLDDPQALELIKKYDLKPGENPKTGSLTETTPKSQ